MTTATHFLRSFSAFTAISLVSSTALAQCPFDPTISPDDLILCPNSVGVLLTETYDSYQWYKDGSPIIGATDQSLVVDSYNDSGSQFSVEATLNGCTEASPQVLVDGWAFLPPTVMTVGPEPLFYSQNGPLYCALDTVLLVMMQPYDTNIQWTDQGVPIPGATDDTLVVHTTGGQFSASGAPSICPDFMQDLGLLIWMAFIEPTQPDIVADGDQLCAYPAGEAFEWYHNGTLIPGSNSACIIADAPGSYVVDVTYLADCSILSEALLVTGLDTHDNAANWRVYPVPATDRITVTWDDGAVIKDWRMFDVTGRVVDGGKGAWASPFAVDVNGLDPGRYWLNVDGSRTIAVNVVR